MAAWNPKEPMPKGWAAMRRHVLATEPLCRPCMMAAGRTTQATAVDHIRARAFGGGHDLDNLMPVCDECHRIKSGMEAAKAQGRTYTIKMAFGEDGWPIEQPVTDYLRRLVDTVPHRRR